MTAKVATPRFITREAKPDDYRHFVRFWAELGLDHAPPGADDWDRLLRPRTIFLEDEAGQVVAYALTFAFGVRGDVRQIAVDPTRRREGVGKALMAAVADRYRGEGVTDWRLEVRRRNAAAIALYRSVGMDVIRPMVTLRMTPDAVRAFALTRSGALHVSIVDPSEDAALERRWDYGAGQFERWRGARGPHARLWKIADRALAQYTPDFAADWGLVFPLCAVDREHVAHLLAAVAELGMRDAVEIQMEEGAVSQALVRGGAREIDPVLEMGGPLPPVR